MLSFVHLAVLVRVLVLVVGGGKRLATQMIHQRELLVSITVGAAISSPLLF